MNPFAMWTLLVALWALCHFWLVPLSKDRWKAVDLREKMTRAGSLVVLERVRDLSGIGSTVICAVILLVWTCSFLASSSSLVPQAVIHAAQSMYGVTREIGSQYGTTLGILGLLGAALSLYFAAHQARERVAQAWSARAQEIHSQIIEDPSLLETARSDSELSPLVARLDELVERLVSHDTGTEGSVLSPQEQERTHELISEVLSFLAIEWARKDLKLEEVIAHPTEQEALLPPSRWRRLLRILSNERLGKDLGLLKKPLSYVTTALLILSLVGWSAEPLANSMQLMVNNLRMNAADQQAQHEMEEALSAIPPAPSVTNSEPVEQSTSSPTVQAATQLFVRAALSEVTRSTALEQWVQTTRSNRVESEFVRAALNDQHIAVPAYADSAMKARQEVAATLGDVVEDKTGIAVARKEIEKVIEPSVARLKQENPNLFSKLTAALEHRYSTPLAPLDAQGKLIAQVLDEAFGAVDVKPTTELGKQAQKLVKDLGKDAVKTWMQAWAKNWMTEALISTARPSVLAVAARQASFETTDGSRQLIKSLMDAEGQGWTSSPEILREAKVAEAVSIKVADLHQSDMKAVLHERLGGYEKLFPSDLPDASSPSGSLGSNTVPRADSRYAADRAFNRLRATNFKVASRSFRVRGVLIGQDIHPTGIDANQIRWTIQAASDNTTTKVVIEIMLNDQWVSLGIYDAAIVNQALRYASDGRVVAVTIAPGDGKLIRRVIHTHPALTDTPLGCRVVEADTFIDRFSISDSNSSGMKNMSSDRQQVYRWLYIAKLTEMLATLDPSTTCPKEEIEKWLSMSHIEAAQFTPALRKSLEDFITHQEQKLPGSGRILSTSNICRETSNDQLSTCLCEKAKGIGLPDHYWFPEDHTSQFRERPMSAGADWKWMKRSQDQLGNIDLWVHTTFSLRRAQDPGTVTDETTATALDFPPEELQQLRQEISNRLPGYLKTQLKSPSYSDFMAPLEDFVLLQRFFRTALAGGFGQDFPVLRLIDLEHATHKYVPYQPTIRWEEVPDAKLMEVLQQADPKAQENYQRWYQDLFLRLATNQAMCDRVSK
ncbi:hypothetical protein [Pseudomonas chlororaphis]|uniref:hypothetical protein n=1 Tax=Pseudomonas chlororaphis TaxID=587753 RepID=UPI0039DFABFE